MNVVLNNSYLLINPENEGVKKEPRTGNHNTLWGIDYFIMNEQTFIEDNIEEIVEIMVKTRAILAK